MSVKELLWLYQQILTSLDHFHLKGQDCMSPPQLSIKALQWLPGVTEANSTIQPNAPPPAPYASRTPLVIGIVRIFLIVEHNQEGGRGRKSILNQRFGFLLGSW
jgi:hypothetical protein